MTWAVETAAGTTRLLLRVTTSAVGRSGRLRAGLLAWGDLVMARKQLLTLQRLAEHDAARRIPG